MEEREEGMTLGEILSLMFKKKLILLIITLVVAVIGIVGILAIYNPMKKTTFIEFYYDKTSLAKGNYSDGQTFKVQDIISLDNVKEVVASNNDYSVLNADDIYDGLKIDTVQEVDEEKKVTSYYKVSILSKKLKNDVLAKKFLLDLVNFPINRDIEIIKNLDIKVKLNQYKDAKTYDDAFKYIRNAYEELTKKYEELIETYGDRDFEDQTFSARMLAAEVFFTNQNLNSFLDEKTGDGTIKDLGLIFDYSFSKRNIQNSLNEINDKLDMVQGQLEAIEEQYNAIITAISKSQAQILSADAQSIIEKWSNLSDQKAQLLKTKEKIDLKVENETATYVYEGERGVKSETQYAAITDETIKSSYTAVNLAEEKAEIKKILDSTYDFLSSQFDLIKRIRVSLNGTEKFLYLQSNSTIKTTGGLNSILAVVLSLLIGLVVGCIVSFALSYGAFKAKKEEELNRKEEERIKKEITYRKMFKENGVDVNQDNK